jgi:Rrf2 family nitric oxide-sensitive transcriptional repressor
VKVLQMLGRARLVRAQRGRGGGFQLSCDPRNTSLLDVVSAIDPLKRITKCPLGRAEHASELCALHRRVDDVAAQLEKSLASMTLQSVIDESPGGALCDPGNGSVGVSVSAKKS